MKNKKTKYYLKNNLIGLIVGGIIFGSLGVYAAITFPSNEVSFDPSNSTLKSTNVKGAIDELYKKCTNSSAADQIIEDAGLEKDLYECRYFFTGANPNNYVTFNNETAGWRIVSVECDGTIKIMRGESIGVFDFADYTWENSNVKNYLNGEYYNNLSNESQQQILEHNFSIGGFPDSYSDTLKMQVDKENAVKSRTIKIGLITATEYLRINSNVESCGTLELNTHNAKTCKNTNWIFSMVPSKSSLWTITPGSIRNTAPIIEEFRYFVNNGESFASDMIGNLEYNNALFGDGNISPALYLSSDIKITGGTGTQSDPYEISL